MLRRRHTCSVRAIHRGRRAFQPQSEGRWRPWREPREDSEVSNGKVGTYVDELLVLGVVAVFGQDAENSLLAVQAFADLVEAFHETYSKEGRVQYQ